MQDEARDEAVREALARIAERAPDVHRRLAPHGGAPTEQLGDAALALVAPTHEAGEPENVVRWLCDVAVRLSDPASLAACLRGLGEEPRLVMLGALSDVLARRPELRSLAPCMIELGDVEDELAVVEVCEFFESTREPSGTALMSRLMKDHPSELVRMYALCALESLGVPVSAFREASADESSWVREAAMEALVRAGLEEWPALLPYLLDPTDHIPAIHAAAAIADLVPEASAELALTHLRATLADPRTPRSVLDAVQRAVRLLEALPGAES